MSVEQGSFDSIASMARSDKQPLMEKVKRIMMSNPALLFEYIYSPPSAESN